MMKYRLSPREIPRVEPEGFPEGSGNISLLPKNVMFPISLVLVPIQLVLVPIKLVLVSSWVPSGAPSFKRYHGGTTILKRNHSCLKQDWSRIETRVQPFQFIPGLCTSQVPLLPFRLYLRRGKEKVKIGAI